MNFFNLLACCLIIVWLIWRSKNIWRTWQAGHLNPKNLYYFGVVWIGIIGFGIKYFN